MYFSMILSTFSEHLFFAEQFSIWLLTHLIPFCLYSNQTMIKAKLIIITHTYTQTHIHTHTHTHTRARARKQKILVTMTGVKMAKNESLVEEEGG